LKFSSAEKNSDLYLGGSVFQNPLNFLCRSRGGIELKMIEKILNENILKIILSGQKNGKYKRVIITKTDAGYKTEKFTETQAFTEIQSFDEMKNFAENALSGEFSNLTAFDNAYEHSVKITKKGKMLINKKTVVKTIETAAETSHNREKNYILKSGEFIPPLYDMGLITESGAVKSDMQGKFRQLVRFIELIDDKIKNLPEGEKIKIADFGCGKSYLSFALFYHLKNNRKLSPEFICIDLKKDVIENCKKAADKYGYEKMEFICGDIMSAENIKADMLITLHACDTATDFALRFAVKNNIKYIFSVPCCQHEIAAQIDEAAMPVMLSHGIIKERFSALLTDSLRSAYLTANGYKTQILEFTGFDDTPKNLLIRAEKANIPKAKREKAMREALQISEYFKVRAEILRFSGD
jgi:SAM-dependent methyltransferase